MQQNMKTPLFLDMAATTEQDTADKEEETDPEVNIQTIMEESLLKVAKMSATNSNRRVSTL
jgi:hypothetical protein